MNIEKQQEVINPGSELRDIELTAMVPGEMVTAQNQLINWVKGKIAVVLAERDDLWLACEHAATVQWKTATLKTQHRNAIKRVQFYEKMQLALEQGYYIVPNFPIQLFAIRTKKGKPEAGNSTNWRETHEQDAQQLAIGEGEYKNPFPIIYSRKVQEGGREVNQTFANDWDDLEFPLTMAKSRIMESTSEAMRLMAFDQMGVMPSVRKKKEDPVIIGQIIQKTSQFSTKIVSFMIAWHLNTNVL